MWRARSSGRLSAANVSRKVRAASSARAVASAAMPTLIMMLIAEFHSTEFVRRHRAERPSIPRSRLVRQIRLDSERAPKSPGGVVRLGPVVVHEDRVVATVAEQRTAELPDLDRCLHPAGRGGIELTELLEPPVLVHGEECRPHGGCHIDGAALRFVLLPRLQRLAVVTDASASLGALRRAIHKGEFARRRVDGNDVRFAAGLLHFIERPEFGTVRLESRLYRGPVDASMAVYVRVEAGLQCP